MGLKPDVTHVQEAKHQTTDFQFDELFIRRKRLLIEDIVSNIDELSQKAIDMQITKADFLDVLRSVTRQKILDVKHASNLF